MRHIIRTLSGVGGLNAHNKDLIRPIKGSIVPYPPPPYPPEGPYAIRGISMVLYELKKEVWGTSCFHVTLLDDALEGYTV